MPTVAPVFLDEEEKVVDTIASSGPDPIAGTPWEKVAARIPDGASVEQILEAADLNWKVAKIPVFAELETNTTHLEAGSQGEGIIEVPDRIRIDVPGSYTCVRLDNRRVISPFLGDRYKVVQNEAAFQAFERFCLVGGLTIETAGALSGGRHVWAMASIDDGIEIAKGEIIKGYFLLMQSHFYGHSLKAMFTPVRYPGGHTLVKAVNVKGQKGYYTMPHSRHFTEERQKEIDELVERAQESLEKYVKTAQMLINSEFTEADGVYFLASVYDPKLITRLRKDEQPMPRTLGDLYDHPLRNRTIRRVIRNIPKDAMDMPSCKGTAWGWYNIVVNDLDKGGRSASTSLEAAWMGKGVRTKVKALNKATIMASTKKDIEEGI